MKRLPTKKTARAPSQEPSETRERLLDAAIEEFAENGFFGARVDTIALSAGVNKQAIYYWFTDKDDIYTQALERCYKLAHEIDDGLSFDDLPADEALNSLFLAVFNRLSELKNVISVIADENRNKGRHLAGTNIRSINRPTIDAIAAILARGKKDGTIRTDIDPEQLWLSLLSLVMFYFTNSYTLSHLLDRDLLDRETINLRRQEIVQLLARSMRPD